MLICRTCAVEYDEPAPAICPICADDRQWVPADGQRWTTLEELREAGQSLTWEETEPGLVGISTDPGVGIAQTAQLVTTEHGSLLWDPTGYLDDETVARIRARGPVLAIAASHPHMYGVQVEWAHALDAPVLVNAADRAWVGRQDPAVEFWSGTRLIAEDLALIQVGGHFAGSAVAHWTSGAEGRGVLLTGDSIFPNPDRQSFGFMRSYPNKIPLSGAVVERLTTQLESLTFDRVIGNFGNRIDADARTLLRLSADRHIGWVRGDFDHLT